MRIERPLPEPDPANRERTEKTSTIPPRPDGLATRDGVVLSGVAPPTSTAAVRGRPDVAGTHSLDAGLPVRDEAAVSALAVSVLPGAVPSAESPRVEELKRAYEAGAYAVPARQLAAKLIDWHEHPAGKDHRKTTRDEPS